MRLNITTSIDAEIRGIAKDNNIALSDALEFGIKFLVAQKDGFGFPDNKLSEKVRSLTSMLQDKFNELETLKNPIKLEQAEKEADDILKDIGKSTI
jgi:phage regulator Rha-like protein